MNTHNTREIKEKTDVRLEAVRFWEEKFPAEYKDLIERIGEVAISLGSDKGKELADSIKDTITVLHQELQKAREETIEKHFTKIGMVHINAFCKLLKSHHSKGNDVMYAVRRTEQYPFIFETKADVAKEVEKYIQSELDQPNK